MLGVKQGIGLCLIIYLFSINFIGISQANNHNPGDNISIIVSDIAGRLSHYQVDEEESRIIWSRAVPVVGHGTSFITDLDKDGNPELFYFVVNDYALLLDYSTGNTIWKLDLPSNSATLASLFSGDLTGDGFEEIVAVTHSFSTVQGDENIMVFNLDGQIIEYIPSNEPIINGYGADNGMILNLNNDGKNDLILSYGSKKWNYSERFGGYAIETWNWDENSESFISINEVNGTEWGGNSRLISYRTLTKTSLITAGWYNNPVRMFDNELNLLWETPFYEGAKYELADSEINILPNVGGEDTLIVVTNSYWHNHSNYIYELDLTDGSIINEFLIENRVSSSSAMLDQTLFLSSIKWVNTTDDIQFYYEIEVIEYGTATPKYSVIETSESMRTFVDYVGSYPQLPVVNYKHPSVLSYDNDGNYIWILNPYQKIRVFQAEGGDTKISGYLNNAPLLEGEKILDLSTEEADPISSYIALIGIISSLLVISSIMVYARGLPEKRFHESFEKDWKVNFYLKLNKIVRRLISEKIVSNEQIMLSNARAITKSDKDDIVVFDELRYPVLPEKFNLPSLRRYAQGLPHFNIWLESLPKKSKNLKIGDIAILIEIMETYPQDALTSELVNKFNFSTKTTIYNRINFLKDMNLIENVGVDIYDEDIRTKKINLSQSGLELLASLFLSLEMSLNTEKSI